MKLEERKLKYETPSKRSKYLKELCFDDASVQETVNNQKNEIVLSCSVDNLQKVYEKSFLELLRRNIPARARVED